MNKAFTLIELLIVVAIIAILAAIAVPNFLEAQTRAKVSRAKTDMRSLATGLEAYMVDNNAYPLCNNEMLPGRRDSDPQNEGYWTLEHLSTPIAYMTNGRLPDPFTAEHRLAITDGNPNGTPPIGSSDFTTPDRLALQKAIKYGAIAVGQNQTGVGNFADTGNAAADPANEKAKSWLLYSTGPDKLWAGTNGIMSSTQDNTVLAQFYDSTNGTASYGDIWRAGGQTPAGTQGGILFFRYLFSIAAR
jgi:prepilin-type N-terminal cleavage/methylation domain-containing protein